MASKLKCSGKVKSSACRVQGFTIIELLVVLVILGLVLSLSVPNINRWLDSRERSNVVQAFTAQVQHLPLKASTQNIAIMYFDGSQLALEEMQVSFSPALKVLENGYCKGANASLLVDDEYLNFEIAPPYCEVRLTSSSRARD